MHMFEQTYRKDKILSDYLEIYFGMNTGNRHICHF
jgi:membrane peptidoglycan carboxypeptidase